MGIKYLKKSPKQPSTDDVKTRDIVQKLLNDLEKSRENATISIQEEHEEELKLAVLKEKNDSTNQKKDRLKENLSDFEKNIVSIIEQYIQPAVAADGGSIVFKSFEEGVVYVILKGACSGCPSSTITLKQGIENLLKQKLGNDIKEVMAYNG